MNPFEAYNEQRVYGWSRIDLLIALYDGAIERISQARECLNQANVQSSAPLLIRAQAIVAELLASLDLQYGELPRNLQRLYIFVLSSIGGSKPDLESALQVLRTLREGLEGIRNEAIELERSGSIPPVGVCQSLQATG